MVDVYGNSAMHDVIWHNLCVSEDSSTRLVENGNHGESQDQARLVEYQ